MNIKLFLRLYYLLYQYVTFSKSYFLRKKEREKERKEKGMDKWQISFKTEQQNHYYKPMSSVARSLKIWRSKSKLIQTRNLKK